MNQNEKLELRNWDEVLAQLQSLKTGEYQQLGAWNLSQCCGHLNQWLSFPMDGFPESETSTKPTEAELAEGKKQLKTIIQDGFTPGIPTWPATVPEPDSKNSPEAVAELTATIKRFQEHAGPIHASPFFGEMDKEQVTQLQFRHFAHHLSFYKQDAS